MFSICRPASVRAACRGVLPPSAGTGPSIQSVQCRSWSAAFLASAGVGDAVHAVWADEFFAAFLKARIPNLEMHVYVNGGYGGGLTDRGGIPFGTWQYRFIDWFRDLGFLQKAALRRKRRGMLLCAWRNRRRRGCHDAVCQIGATAW